MDGVGALSPENGSPETRTIRELLLAVRDPLEDWETFGRIDPYYGVITREVFHKENLTEAGIDAFFDTGRSHVESLFETIEREIAPAFSPGRALDFGCGVGRLTIPLASRCEKVVGVDASVSMLALARQHGEERGISNMEFLHTPGGLEGLEGDFDFVHSYIVFQHIPPCQGRRLFVQMLGRLREGGVGALHLTFHRRLPGLRLLVNWMQKTVPLAQNLVNLVKGRHWAYPHMQMNRYDMSDILYLLHEASCEKVRVQFTDHDGHIGAFLLFQKTAGSSPAPHLSFENQGQTPIFST